MADWQISPFEECIEPVVYTAKVQRKDFLADGAYPVISQEEAFINGFWDQEADIFRVERPLVVFGDHTRTFKYIDFDFVLGADGVKVLKPKPFLHPRFFYYQLHTAKLDSLGYARHYRLLKEHKVAYPAYAEQQRIVAILDEAFEAIAIAKANAEANFRNVRELFDGIQRERLTRVTPCFVHKELQSLCEVFFDSAHRTPKYQADGIPALRPRDVVNGALTLSAAARVSEGEYEVQSKRYKPRPGDIVYSRELSYGWAAIVPPDTTVCLSQGMCVFRPAEGVSPRYLWRILNSPIGRIQAHQAAVGTSHPHINISAIKAYLIPNFSQDQQRTFVDFLD
ncbi:MAG: restriction endonuclease subunit S, partial [bacterium]